MMEGEMKFVIVSIIVMILMMMESINGQTCFNMWDPIFEANFDNPPTMCPVSTTSGASCVFPFVYDGITYVNCTIQGPNNADFEPQCATAVDSNNVPITWSNCIVPTDAVIFYATVRKNGPWTQNTGSLQGGTMLWIYGARFAPNGFSTTPSTSTTNTVQLVDGYSVYDCEMHIDKITSTQLTCYAPVIPEGLYQIRVYVNDNLIPLYQYTNKTQATFAAVPSATPIISNIMPQTGTPQTLISLSGIFQTACISRDIVGCSDDNNPLISRTYVGGHLCNLINPITGANYSVVTDTYLQCFFEGTEVGLFNISVLVTNQYGRTLVNSNLYRISANEKLYNFQSYAVISSVSPTSGSTQGGTILTITGNFFSTNVAYPLIVNVGGQPCTILFTNLTIIQCQIPSITVPSSRGLELYHDSVAYTQATLSSTNPPSPSSAATHMSIDDASYVSNSSSDETVWIIGFVRISKTAIFTFSLQTNGNGALFLSTDDDPSNKILIVDPPSYNQSGDIVLQNNTNYYIFCVASRTGGYLNVSIQGRMHETTLTATTSSMVLNEIQRIDVNANVVSERQILVYTTNSNGNGTSEVQSVQVDNSIFQIGFRGAYTALLNGQPTPEVVQTALNDLPTIYPLSVTVTATSTLYIITFPPEMDNVPLLTCISTSTNPPNVTEIVQGVASGSQIAFEFDGQLTEYIDFTNNSISSSKLQSIFNEVFSIQCPISLNNIEATTSIVYLEDFETNCYYDETNIELNAFCGQCSQVTNVVVNGNTQIGNYLCFAYKLSHDYVIELDLAIQMNGDTIDTYYPTIPLSLNADQNWHYICINILSELTSQSSSYNSPSLVITYATLDRNILNSITIDTVTIRTSLPNGYEDVSSYPIDQSASSSCVFPFYYNGQQYSKCILNPNNNLPICADASNQTYECSSSSIEGVRRLYPKHQLVYNTLKVVYTSNNNTIDVSYRYSDCFRPALIVSYPISSTTITRLSQPSISASGTFDLVFNAQTYPSIPVNITAADLANRLQLSSDFGFLNVTRLGYCTGYSYLIEWIANGGQKTDISITNAGSVAPVGTTVTASVVQHGGVLYSPLPGDLTCTYHTVPQVEVFVGGYPSLCSDNTCDFQWLSSQTPTISSVTQNGMSLTITGTGFSTILSSNTVLIGTSGSCTVLSATTTSISCTISNAPSGIYTVGINVTGKGYALESTSFTVTIPLQITSISPSSGGAGGGYTLTVTGTGFSQNAVVTVDNNICSNPIITNFSIITCIVPATTAINNIQVIVSVVDGTSVVNGPSLFTYNVNNTPTITSLSSSVVRVAGEQLTIIGTLFGTNSISVLIGNSTATIVSSSNTQIVVILPSLPAGIYPVYVSTINGYARPSTQIEYRFYVQSVSPQVGSLYGGTDVYVQGQGFDNSTTVNFTNDASEIPCNVVSVQSTQIHCVTTAAAPQLIITSNGIDPINGAGFAWLPQYATVQQGANVTWQWGLSALLSSITYKVQQLPNGYATNALSGGFDSGNASTSGSFSYQFLTLGNYYYWSTPVDSTGLISLRGVITVVAAEPQTLTVEVTSNSFTAQSCVFPFTFNGTNYTSCTTIDDTQLWCSPSAIYTGQRLYCTPTNSIPVSSCSSSTVLNPSTCSQTVPTSSPLEFLFTPCTIGSVTSISPLVGSAGTSITITGTGFSSTACENIVEIGLSYTCPIISATSTQIICEIATGSLLNGKTNQSIQVAHDQQGYLINDGALQFQFKAIIDSISPTQGSTAGGTLVTIYGDGFVPADTRVIVGDTEYTSIASITYSQITFTTLPLTIPAYLDQDIPITILVGTNTVICSPISCTFRWSSSVTPYINSVSPTSITGPATLTLTGENLEASNSATISNTYVTINNHICNVTSIINSTIICQVDSIEAGTYTVIASISGVGNVISSASVTSVASLTSESPTNIGIYGGALVTILGNGFSNTSSVKIGSNPCTIVSISTSQIVCTAPAQNTNPLSSLVNVTSNSVRFPSTLYISYSSSITPIVSSISPTSGSISQVLTITGSNFVNGQTNVFVGGVTCTINSISSTSITCTVGSIPAGYQSVIVQIPSVGTSNSNIQFLSSLSVNNVVPNQGSYGGGQLVTITGNGFNGSAVDVTICNQPCQTVTVLSNTILTCETPSATVSSSDTTCTLIVTVNGLSQNSVFTYQNSLTSTVISVSPTRGGTGGGTTLTITGTNFPNSINDVSVSIAGVSCSVQTISSTTITCFTGSYAQTTVEATVIVSVTNAGNAISSAQFQYIDLWSSSWTWGGEAPPEAGTIVVIDNGKTVYFDTITPIITAIIIDNASLIFDDNQDVALNVKYILVVNGGHFQVGTESNPFQHNAIITMYGQLRSIELPIYGAKVLALRDGIVDMHGKDVGQTWTRLSSTATMGSSQISLQIPVNWGINDSIVIATTGNYESQGESEVRTIVGISSNRLTLTLDSPLNYTHLGITKTVGTTTVDIRAEVGLLSHNILFQGSVEQTWDQTIPACPDGFDPGEFATMTCFLGRYGEEIGSDQFGATIMASASNSSSTGDQPAILRLSNIEVFNAGQAFRLGRYPVHFHMNGNMSLSYVKSSAIHQTFNRAINIHASNYLTIQNNVVYDIMGGAMFLEDGVEIGNIFDGNLAVFVQTSSSLLNEDVTPAAIWVTNPNNIVINNAAAGGTHFGYWYRMLETPDGPSFSTFPDFCPFRQPFGRFYNNSVHSVGRIGVWIFPEYSPTVAGSCSNDAPYQAVFEKVTTWGNARGFEWVMSSTIQIKGAIAFDNVEAGLSCVSAINDQATNLPNLQATFYNISAGSSVINSLIVGDSGTSSSSIVPSDGGLIVMWDRGLRVQNVTFINFPDPDTQAIRGPIIEGRCVVGCGGWLTKFSQLNFINVLNRGQFRWSYDGIYQDEDGTLGNIPGATIMPPDGLWNTSNACTPTPHFVNSITCPGSLGNFLRFSFNQANLDQNGETLFIYDSSNHVTNVPSLQKRLTHPNGYMMVLQSKQTYTFEFENENSTTNLSYTGVVYSLSPGDYLIIQQKMDYMPDQVNTISSSSMVTQSSTPLSGLTSNNGDWYYDNDTSLFSYIVKNPSTNVLQTDVSLYLSAIKCRYPNCVYPISPGLTLPATARPSTALYWSNDSDWSFATQGYGGYGSIKPGNGTDIYIPSDIWLVVDYPLPTILSLRIDGVLEFEQGMNNILNVNSILINGGQLIVGWPNDPLTSNVDIVIQGDASVNVLLPNDGGSIGPKVIGVLGGLDLHGLPRNVSWTRLGATALSNQNTIVLSEPVDWNVGDEIILTTTDNSLSHTERHTIETISSNQLVITTVLALNYTHIVINEVYPNGRIVHIAGAVGLLTRNVRVINRSPASELFGFRIYISDYATNIWNPSSSEYLYTYYKGFARISDTHFIGYGQFVDAPDEDKREGIHMYDLGDWNASRPTYVDSCSFDGGSYSAIGIWNTSGVPITNNVVYNTYQSGIVTAGQNTIIDGNLVVTVYWSGTAEPSTASLDINYDGAIMSRDGISVVMTNNFVAGVERIGYRVQGDACPNTTVSSNITNHYANNEVHCAMAGVAIWPTDPGFGYDTECVLFSGFTTYKSWYYGLYINTDRNIIVDSCTVVDGSVGILTFVIGPSPLTHMPGNNSIVIQNSLVIGSITPDDCDDVLDTTSNNVIYAATAIPSVSATSTDTDPGGRSGIVFPFISGGDNMMPRHPWTNIDAYPCINGIMKIINVTFTHFNDICSRRDIAIQVAQHDDDGQFPVVTSLMSLYNVSQGNIIFNGRPNLDVVDPSDCVDMDCDGLKKNLLIDTDGTLVGQPSSIISQAGYDWGDQAHGVGDYRIPEAALSNSNGQMININTTYPYRGISLDSTCVYQSSWQMYLCRNRPQYRMLIIESMDSDTETRRLSPIAVMSDNGYIDLLNGPQDHGWCDGYTCQKRISTFMSLIESQHQYNIYLSSTPPNQIRFRILNSDATIVNSIALYYNSIQQIDVYANGIYVYPANRNPSYQNTLMLTDQPTTLSYSLP
ncbi:unnamed protein product, partial [Adineta steineri]